MEDPRPPLAMAAPSAVTVGAFDGVHLGHRRLIKQLRSAASRLGLRSVVVTFDRHPASVVRPESAPLLLTDLEQKLELLDATGVDEVVVLSFDAARAAEAAEEFIEEVLVARVAARLVVVGSDFHFGNERRGNVALLESMGAKYGFSVEGFELAESDGVISSTRIRSLVESGNLRGAAALLGRPHEVRGVVRPVGGDGRCELVARPEILLPGAGRYAGRIGPLGGGLEDHVLRVGAASGGAGRWLISRAASLEASSRVGDSPIRWRAQFLAAVDSEREDGERSEVR